MTYSPILRHRPPQEPTAQQHWRPLTADQRTEFIPLFADLVDRAYMSTIERYSGEPIQYSGERVEGDLAVVSTKILTKQDNQI